MKMENPYEAYEIRFSHRSDVGLWLPQPPVLVRTNARDRSEAIALARRQLSGNGDWIYEGAARLPDRGLIGEVPIVARPRLLKNDSSLPEDHEEIEHFARWSAE